MPHLCVTCWKVPVISTFSEKIIFAQCYCKFSMHFITSIGKSATILLLYTSICTCKNSWRPFLYYLQYHTLLFLYNLELIYKFLCIVKISSLVILQMWENKSGAGVDPHAFCIRIIFDLYAVVSNFVVKRAHNYIGSFSRWFSFVCRLCL